VGYTAWGGLRLLQNLFPTQSLNYVPKTTIWRYLVWATCLIIYRLLRQVVKLGNNLDRVFVVFELCLRPKLPFMLSRVCHAPLMPRSINASGGTECFSFYFGKPSVPYHLLGRSCYLGRLLVSFHFQNSVVRLFCKLPLYYKDYR
jgi:hypothetical protein